MTMDARPYRKVITTLGSYAIKPGRNGEYRTYKTLPKTLPWTIFESDLGAFDAGLWDYLPTGLPVAVLLARGNERQGRNGQPPARRGDESDYWWNIVGIYGQDDRSTYLPEDATPATVLDLTPRSVSPSGRAAAPSPTAPASQAQNQQRGPSQATPRSAQPVQEGPTTGEKDVDPYRRRPTPPEDARRMAFGTACIAAATFFGNSEDCTLSAVVDMAEALADLALAYGEGKSPTRS